MGKMIKSDRVQYATNNHLRFGTIDNVVAHPVHGRMYWVIGDNGHCKLFAPGDVAPISNKNRELADKLIEARAVLRRLEALLVLEPGKRDLMPWVQAVVS